jgi:hypothetical protein
MVQRPDDEADPRDFDARWAEIVADLGEPEGIDVPEGPQTPPAGHVVRAADERILSGRDWAGTDQIDAAEEAVDEQEHFVPPDPGPVLGSDPLRVLTWAVAIGVPVLYVILLVAWHDPPGWLAPVAGVLLLTAIGVLVWRMPHRRDQDSDSGAVV